MNEAPDLSALAPMPPPYPPLPRFLFATGGGSPETPELPAIVPEEIEDMLGAAFYTMRGVYSMVSLRRTLDKLIREPTSIFPLGTRRK